MKRQLTNSTLIPISKKLQTPRKSRNFIPLLVLASLLTIISFYFPFCHTKLPHNGPPAFQTKPDFGPKQKTRAASSCDLFNGEWVPNPEGPYYTNLTCDFIQDHQNCMKYGRPDTEFLKWKWKPDGCELPVFDPTRFLEMMRGKTMAFVGDSVARNHMQSLLCLLSKVAHPLDLSNPNDQNRFYAFTEYNFNVSMSFTPYLVNYEKKDDVFFNLYLDEPDQSWTTKIDEKIDYILISAGPWFLRPTYFYLNHTLTSCLYCHEPNITHLTYSFSYRTAFHTALKAINDAVNYNGVTFLRTYAPSHFEGGEWDSGGNCVRTRPFKRNETALMGPASEFHSIQLEVLRTAQNEMNRNNKFRLFDATKPMLLRPDGHPSKYGHPLGANVVLYNDCVHWCLPGPIDTWNDFLQELLMREIEN